MATFKAFANESQVVSFTSGDDEMSLENGTTEIILAGTLRLNRDDPSTRTNLLQLQKELSNILATLA